MTVSDSPPADREQAALEKRSRIYCELLRQVFGSSRPGIAINLLLAAAFVVVVRDSLAPAVLAAWLGALALLNGWRWVVAVRYRTVVRREEAERGERSFMVALALSSAVWSWMVIQVIDDPALRYGAFMLAAVFGLSGGAMAILGQVARLYAAYVVPLLVPAGLHLIAHKQEIPVLAGVMTLVFTAALVRTCIGFEKRAIERVRARMDNETLVDELRDAVARAGETNARLQVEAAERREAEAAQAAATGEAQRANRAKSDFLATMSHEIRTPLNAIVGFSELLSGRPLAEAERDYADRINTASLSLLALVNDILDFSKIEAGKLELDEAPFDLGQVLRQSAAANEFNASRKNIGFETRIAPDTPTRLVGDATRLAQILTNLASNAVKFTASGGVFIDVCRVAGGTGDSDGRANDGTRENVTLRFTVRDTGMGIAPDKQQLIFDAFTQADHSTTRHFGGTGLGLAICKRLALLMGGDIELTSEPGRGSAFSVTLPLMIDPHAETRSAESAIAAPAALAGRRVLVVDDNPINLKLVALMLRKLGLDAEVAESGTEAIALCDEEPFDAVLMDIEMPDMNGFEACKRIHAIRPLTPVLALTAHATSEIAQASTEAGMRGYLTKPVTTPALRRALSDVFGEAPVAP